MLSYQPLLCYFSNPRVNLVKLREFPTFSAPHVEGVIYDYFIGRLHAQYGRRGCSVDMEGRCECAEYADVDSRQ